MREEIPALFAGERIDRVVAALTDLPRSVVAELITNGAVALDGRVVATRSAKVSEGALLDVDVPTIDEGPPAPDDSVVFDVIYEDDDLVVIDKPAGLVVHPGSGHASGTLVNGLVARFGDIAKNLPGDPARPGIVHRLDAGTSGLLVVARNASTYDALVDMMKERDVTRRYVALVWGDVQPDHGVIDAPIGRSEKNRTKMAVSSGGRAARTHYSVTQRSHGPVLSCCDVALETGRTHQIRVHFAAIGHPVAGDAQYRGVRPGLDVPRPFLHARALEFVHPVSKQTVQFESPLPADLGDVLAGLDLY